MKSQWNFKFECKGFKFDGLQKFDGYISDKNGEKSNLSPENRDFYLIIEPDPEAKFPGVEQTGKLKVVLPGDMEQTKELAHWIADHASEYISFFHGELNILGGLVVGEYLPETPEEEEQLGEKRYFAIANLVQYPPAPVVDGSSIQQMALNSTVNSTMQQYNAALRANNPIDQFLGLFRILEDFYESNHKYMAEALKKSSELLGIACQYLKITEKGNTRPVTKNDYFKLVKELVGTRNQCAHLRTQKGFGIPHGDPRVEEKVKPLITPLSRLAFEAIRIRLGKDDL